MRDWGTWTLELEHRQWRRRSGRRGMRRGSPIGLPPVPPVGSEWGLKRKSWQTHTSRWHSERSAICSLPSNTALCQDPDQRQLAPIGRCTSCRNNVPLGKRWDPQEGLPHYNNKRTFPEALDFWVGGIEYIAHRITPLVHLKVIVIDRIKFHPIINNNNK